MTEMDDIWIEPWMMKLVAGVVFLFILGLLAARYYHWFGFGGF
jgi:hypothetical protein